ncbi:bifunctional 5,10-methylenetetrahydrofolate dehydrogenase/5,10-methenyltetrahydrofolate cyclohydrolase [Patescibacteria group bacterium]|nr:bifunctional 5,10-methylenetetrahydrofolate dehydrogenase/5,10-methenyltetrahydrofolate cyclohydrolase [Patescibacteria group bacterium]
MIVDGRKIANAVLARVKARAAKLPHRPKVVALAGNGTPATRSYLRVKKKTAALAGCVFEEIESPDSFASADAVIIQLPIAPADKYLLDAIPVNRDADVLSRAAREKFERGDADALLPPVVAAIAEIFETYHIEPEGKRAVVIGEGFLVGAPTATWLGQKHAHVSVIHDSANLKQHLAGADIIISGAGAPHIIKPDLLKQGVVLIDAGTSESSGVIVGDADPACAERCSLFTPVPGGVGPLAVAKLFENVVTLAEKAMNI